MPIRALTTRLMAIAIIALLLAGTAACAAVTATAGPAGRASCSGPAASLRLHGAVNGVASAPGGEPWAVGWAGETDLTARWDGTAWRRVPAPSPGPAGVSIALNGVAVASARSAWAVGYANGRSALIVHWDGTTWTQVPSPDLPLAYLDGVVAITPANAWAVGYSGPFFTAASLILHWDGRAWRRIPSPAPGSHSALGGVAATSPGNVWAVGNTASPPTRRPGIVSTLILHWDGTAWSRVPSPNPSGNSTLTSVTAISPADAWAVGFTGTIQDTHPRALIMHWDGTTWQQVPTPPIPDGGILYSVSASSAADVWAVGQIGGNTNLKPSTLVLHWDGRAWSSVPGPAGTLLAVAVSSSHSAWAVGVNATATSQKTIALSCTVRGLQTPGSGSRPVRRAPAAALCDNVRPPRLDDLYAPVRHGTLVIPALNRLAYRAPTGDSSLRVIGPRVGHGAHHRLMAWPDLCSSTERSERRSGRSALSRGCGPVSVRWPSVG